MIEDIIKDGKPDLGIVIGNYVNQIGASNAISLYNKFCSRVNETRKGYDMDKYVRICNRWMRYQIFKYDITTQSDLVRKDVEDMLK